MFKLICGLLRPTTGTVTVQGKQLGKDCDFAPDVGVLIETPSFIYYESGYRNLRDLAAIRKKIGVEQVKEHWHLSGPRQMIDYLALAGDSSDNIPGIKGIGEKSAAALLEKWGFVEGMLEHADEIDLREVVPLGYHLRAEQNIRLSVSEFGQYLSVREFRRCGVHIHP